MVGALLCIYLVGFAGGACYALIPSLNDDRAMQSRANGARAQLGSLGSMLGPPLFAVLIARFGINGLCSLAIGLGLAGTIVAVVGLRQVNLPTVPRP